jgi:hypothetical protein
MDIDSLDAIEPVTFIGYPNALYDTFNMTPIARRGWTATPIALDYGGAPKFLIDASVFPGSSGSPVFIFDSGGFGAKEGAFVVGSRLFLVGIVAAVHYYKTTGEILTATAQPQVHVDEMIDLGIVYKTRTIVETIDALLATHRKTRLRSPVTPAVAATAVPHEPESVPGSSWRTL